MSVKTLACVCCILMLILLILPVVTAEVTVKQAFDGDGRLIQEDYVNEDGKLVAGPYGYACRLLTYSEDGLEVTETYCDVKDRQVADSQGRYGITETFDESGRLVARMTLNKNGAAAKDPVTGAYGETFEYDANGFLSKHTLVNASGAAMVGLEGWAITTFVNDDQGNPLSERYFNAKEAAVVLATGYAGIDRTFDDRGNVL